MDKKEVCNGRINQFGLCNKCCQPSQGSSAYCNRMIPSPIVSDQEKERQLRNEFDNWYTNFVMTGYTPSLTDYFKYFYSIIEKERKSKHEIAVRLSDTAQRLFVIEGACTDNYLNLQTAKAQIQELQREIDDNRKVIAANGMTIGELRKELEFYKSRFIP